MGLIETGSHDGYLDPEQHNRGALRGEDLQLDFNSPMLRVEVPTGKHESWKITSDCGSCGGKTVKAYKDDIRYLKEKTPFSCRQYKIISDLKPGDGEESEIIATPRPKMARIKDALLSGIGAGAAQRSRTGSVSSCNSVVTVKSVQINREQLGVHLEKLEEAQLNLKNMCTILVMKNEALNVELKSPMINEYLAKYQEAVEDIDETAEDLRERLARLEEMPDIDEEATQLFREDKESTNREAGARAQDLSNQDTEVQSDKVNTGKSNSAGDDTIDVQNRAGGRR